MGDVIQLTWGSTGTAPPPKWLLQFQHPFVETIPMPLPAPRDDWDQLPSECEA